MVALGGGTHCIVSVALSLLVTLPLLPPQ